MKNDSNCSRTLGATAALTTALLSNGPAALADGPIQPLPLPPSGYSTGYSLAENPVWDHTEGCLYFADLHYRSSPSAAEDPKILRHCPGDANPQTTIVSEGFAAYSLHRHRDGGFVAGGLGGLYWVSDTIARPTVENGGVRLIYGVDPDPNDLIWHFVNEAVVTPNGGIYFGTVVLDLSKILGTPSDPSQLFQPGSLYFVSRTGPSGDARVFAGGSLLPGSSQVAAGVLSNGLGLSPDGRTLYWAVSVDRAIYAFDVDRVDGSLEQGRPLVRLDDTLEPHGFFDGLTVDSAGNVLVAVWYLGEIRKYDRLGNYVGSIVLEDAQGNLLDPQVANVTFGGADFDELYVTTSADPVFYPQLSDFSPFLPALPSFTGGVYKVSTDTPGLIERRPMMPIPAAPN